MIILSQNKDSRFYPAALVAFLPLISQQMSVVYGSATPFFQIPNGAGYERFEASIGRRRFHPIQGESGTGKELVAGAIHFNGARAGRPLVAVNCSALSESLLESELFGHARGAFTGAVRDRMGRFEEAHGGTIFLDEIGEISPYIQVKLLRVLQEKEIQRVGESKSRKIDIRIIAATNSDLYSLVKGGKFREDLYYRLKVFPITVSPLRDRKEDLPLLISHFVQVQNRKTGKHIKGVSPTAMRIMLDYSWPGNVRELENAVEHAFVLCEKDEIHNLDLPVEIRQTEYPPNRIPAVFAMGSPARPKIMRETSLELLVECGWNKAEVARRLGLSRTAVWKYMGKTKRCNGNSLMEIITDVNASLRGWFEYFKHSNRWTFSAVDGWVRRRLRSILRKRSKRRGKSRGRDHNRWTKKFFLDYGLFCLEDAHKSMLQPS